MIRLSPSSINLFLEDPRAFYFEKKLGIKRPRGIFPSLPNGLDRVIKERFDDCRSGCDLPKEFLDHPESKNIPLQGFRLYSNQDQLKKWRHWKTGLRCTGKNYELSGGIDDLLHNPDLNVFAPLDYKSKGSEPTAEDAEKYYKAQLAAYALLMQRNKMETAGFGILLFFYPDCYLGNVTCGTFEFDCRAIAVPTDLKWIDSVCEEAAALLESPTPPPVDPKNEWDLYFEELKNVK